MAARLTLSCALFSLAINALTSAGAVNDSVQMSAEQTCLKTGPDYRPVYDSSGMPIRCEAPARPMCFFGPYTDPKTGLEGCCGLDKGDFSTDPSHPKEGACCVTPQTYSFDPVSSKGSCCDSGQSYSVDANTGVGGCCVAPMAYKCQCAAPPATGGTNAPSGGNIPSTETDDDAQQPITDTVPDKCPDAHGWTFTQDGVDYMIDCENGWNQKLGQGSWTKAADIWECLKNCGAAGASCQGVNYWAATQDCGFALNWEYPATGVGDPALMAAIPLKQKP